MALVDLSQGRHASRVERAAGELFAAPHRLGRGHGRTPTRLHEADPGVREGEHPGVQRDLVAGAAAGVAAAVPQLVVGEDRRQRSPQGLDLAQHVGTDEGVTHQRLVLALDPAHLLSETVAVEGEQPDVVEPRGRGHSLHLADAQVQVLGHRCRDACGQLAVGTRAGRADVERLDQTTQHHLGELVLPRVLEQPPLGDEQAGQQQHDRHRSQPDGVPHEHEEVGAQAVPDICRDDLRSQPSQRRGHRCPLGEEEDARQQDGVDGPGDEGEDCEVEGERPWPGPPCRPLAGEQLGEEGPKEYSDDRGRGVEDGAGREPAVAPEAGQCVRHHRAGRVRERDRRDEDDGVEQDRDVPDRRRRRRLGHRGEDEHRGERTQRVRQAPAPQRQGEGDRARGPERDEESGGGSRGWWRRGARRHGGRGQSQSKPRAMNGLAVASPESAAWAAAAAPPSSAAVAIMTAMSLRFTGAPHLPGLPAVAGGHRGSAAGRRALAHVHRATDASSWIWDDGSVARVRTRPTTTEEDRMSKRARKRRSRKGKAANHGRKPNA